MIHFSAHWLIRYSNERSIFKDIENDSISLILLKSCSIYNILCPLKIQILDNVVLQSIQDFYASFVFKIPLEKTRKFSYESENLLICINILNNLLQTGDLSLA
jgi:hypothetical protein